VFVGVTVAGLLENGVIDDRLDCPGVHREVDAEDERGDDIREHVLAESAHQNADEQRDPGQHQHTSPGPPVGENARDHLDQRNHRGVPGGHHADRGGIEPDLGHEQFLDRDPDPDPLRERGRLQWKEPPRERRSWSYCGGCHHDPRVL
jgi:hypothetical protein